jgi:hypothetical protein
MSLTYNQIIREIEKNCGLGRGEIMNDPDLKQDFTDDINMAMSQVFAVIFSTGGTWQFDDINHAKYPIITTDIVQGIRDYAFVQDEEGALILDIYKLIIETEEGNKKEIPVIDQQGYSNNQVNLRGFNDNETGVPSKADLTANGIFFDVIPNYSKTDGLEVYINREGVFFSTSDTDKKPGFNPLFHEYVALVPSYKYARNHTLPNVDRIERDIAVMESNIKENYGKRNRAVDRRLQANIENNR